MRGAVDLNWVCPFFIILNGGFTWTSLAVPEGLKTELLPFLLKNDAGMCNTI